jgi:hypothetical protein
MRSLLLSVVALGGLALFTTAAAAQPPGYDHDRYHDDLEHRAYHRSLEHQDAHRYPMTWRDHQQLHDELDHEAFHDRLEHREFHRQYYYAPSYQVYPSYVAPGYGSYGGSYYVPYQSYVAPSYGFGVQGRSFSIYVGR